MIFRLTLERLLLERLTDRGLAGMKMPPFAPSRPFRKEPSVLVTLPCAFSSAVFSPRYQTVPCLSWAYQSVVRSARRR